MKSRKGRKKFEFVGTTKDRKRKTSRKREKKRGEWVG